LPIVSDDAGQPDSYSHVLVEQTVIFSLLQQTLQVRRVQSPFSKAQFKSRSDSCERRGEGIDPKRELRVSEELSYGIGNPWMQRREQRLFDLD